MRTALLSNKQDTAEVAKELGDLWVKYSALRLNFNAIEEMLIYYKKMYKRATIANLLLGTSFGAGMTLGITGTIMEANGQRNFLHYTGFSIAGTAAIVWTGGKFIFKVW